MIGIMTNIKKGTFIKRYKRFFADIKTQENQILTAYCPNTGRLTTCLEENAPVILSKSDNPKRKFPYTLNYIYTNNTWICINTQKANPIIEKALKSYALHTFTDYDNVKAEIPINQCRFDFGLYKENKLTDLIEVKSVTYCKNDMYYFPDAPTTRGQKQLKELIECQKKNIQCHVLFLAMRDDGHQFKPAEHIDKKYTHLLKEAYNNGVQIHCHNTNKSDTEQILHKKIPVILEN